VESGNHLGIYWREDRATVVCLAPPGRARPVVDCFSVTTDGKPQQGQQALADKIVRTCRERKVKFTEAAVALDCAAFMQHAVHSEFRDPKQIAATVRFDTEEALATDISEMAVAFRVTSSTDEGARLDVFTAQRAILSDILLSLQSHGIDPVAVDPDVCCLSRYLTEYAPASDAPEQTTLHALLSDSRGYLIVLSGSRQPSVLRTFLIGASQERTGLLARETLVTTALAETGQRVSGLRVFDARGAVRTESLREGTGLTVGTCDLAGLAGAKLDETPDSPNAVDFALACGAALSPAQKTNSVNLRNDHMPYLGRKRVMQNAVRLLSISLTMLLLAVGVWFHSQLIRVNTQRERLRDKLETDYLPVMLGEKKMPMPMSEAVRKLEGALRRVKAEKQGTGDLTSVSAKLTQVILGINGCARQIDLNIDSITITSALTSSIIITGDTSSRQNTTKVMQDALKKVGLEYGPMNVRTEGGRDAFSITLELEKKGKGT
jgi:hypothetical protein